NDGIRDLNGPGVQTCALPISLAKTRVRESRPLAAPGARDARAAAADSFEGGERLMKALVSQWSLILLCFSFAVALGGGIFEHSVLMPIWSKSPPSSFSIIQTGSGVPLQRFWIPVHIAITVFIILSLVITWGHATV